MKNFFFTFQSDIRSSLQGFPNIWPTQLLLPRPMLMVTARQPASEVAEEPHHAPVWQPSSIFPSGYGSLQGRRAETTEGRELMTQLE